MTDHRTNTAKIKALKCRLHRSFLIAALGIVAQPDWQVSYNGSKNGVSGKWSRASEPIGNEI
jgi:hypothetical protein